MRGVDGGGRGWGVVGAASDTAGGRAVVGTAAVGVAEEGVVDREFSLFWGLSFKSRARRAAKLGRMWGARTLVTAGLTVGGGRGGASTTVSRMLMAKPSVTSSLGSDDAALSAAAATELSAGGDSSTGSGGKGRLILAGDGSTGAVVVLDDDTEDDEVDGKDGAVLSPLLVGVATVSEIIDEAAVAAAVGLGKDAGSCEAVVVLLPPPFSIRALCMTRRMGPLSRGSVN